MELYTQLDVILKKYNPIRRAQKKLAQEFENVKILGDLDLVPINKPYRYNGCRLSPKGAKQLSKMILFSLIFID